MPSLYAIIHIDIIPPCTDAAVELLKEHADTLRGRPGVERVEVLRQVSRKNHFEFLVIFPSSDDFDAYVSSPTTVSFRETLHPMLGSPIDYRLHHLMD